LFYTERVGKNGEVFNIMKFRTMVKMQKRWAVFATSNDTRITPFGKILRKSRIDRVSTIYQYSKRRHGSNWSQT
jgi:lipopolysaccharide/colanic/teichoic acid biosynthesis glycosyltransferase